MVISTMELERHEEYVMERRPEKLIKECCTKSLLTERPPSVAKEPRYKNIVHLWEFLLELLAQDSCKSIICWSRRDYREFKLKNPEEVAKRWGLWKGKKGMNYEKLSRALRYYYQQGIIKKVPGQRLVYKFNRLPYKYEPGVTRSLSHTKQTNTSVIAEQDQKPATSPPPQITTGFSPIPSSFLPTITLVRKDWSWPVVPMPTRPVWCYPGALPPKPPIFSTGSRIMFPFVETLTSLPLGFKPVEPLPSVYEALPFSNTSIPVSVIQRTA
ncbi:hypothetical protein ACROYT_G032909 [Oculina patagonica]